MERNVSFFKYNTHLDHNDDPYFDEVHTPGTRAKYSGIYRCIGCGHEDACNAGNPLPPQNHHQHKPSQGHIRWKLNVCATVPRG